MFVFAPLKKILSNGKAIAKCFMVNKDNVYTLNQRICSLKPKIVPGFLMYKINRNPYYLSFDDGVKQTNLRRDDVLWCKLWIPKSKEEQTRIATVLSDMDELISQLDELIAKKKAIKQWAMQSLLTPKEDWEVKKLGEICELQNGYSFKSSTYTPNGKYLIVTIANVQDGYMDTSECNKIIELPKDIQEHQELNLGDLLISMTGNVGRVCKVDTRNTLLNQRVGRLNPINVEVSFLYYLLNDRKFIKQMIIIAQGWAQCNLSKKDIDNYEVNIPTSREEQIRIATILSDMDNEIQELEQKKAKYEQIKQWAMQQLLTGKIRLK